MAEKFYIIWEHFSDWGYAGWDDSSEESIS